MEDLRKSGLAQSGSITHVSVENWCKELKMATAPDEAFPISFLSPPQGDTITLVYSFL